MSMYLGRRNTTVGVAVLALSLVGLTNVGWAQADTSKTIHGQVVDAETGAPLPQANLRVANTYRGTITNAQGQYTLEVDRLPATIVVRYIGFESERRRITAESDAEQSFQLVPSTVEMGEVVVTGSGNPGAEIMQRVIENKQDWWPELERYSVEAYTRYSLAQDTTIAAIAETQTTAFWDRDRGTREVVRSRRGTANLGDITDAAFPAAASVLNLYADDVNVFGNRLVGVTHPEALDYYLFELDTVRAVDGQRAFVIRAEPQRRTSSTFRGTVTVLDDEYALLEADLRPTPSLGTTRVLKKVDIRFEQTFSNFGGRFWLPVDFRAQRDFDVQVSALLSFSEVKVRQVSRLSDYRINVPLPDSLYESEEDVAVVEAADVSTVDSTWSVQGDSLPSSGPFVPYSLEERRAYSRIDSTDAIENTFEPGGLIGWLQDVGVLGDDFLSLDVNSGDEASDDEADADSTASADSTDADGLDVGFAGGLPIVRMNRVEEAHLGARLRFEAGPLNLTTRGGYNTGPSGPTRWSYGGEITAPVTSETVIDLSYHFGIDPRYRARSRMARAWARLSNSLWVLAGEPDYYDYFGNERMRLAVRQDVPTLDLDLELQLRNERHFSVPKTSDYDVAGRGQMQPSNPAIQPGWLRSLYLEASVGDDGLLGVFPMDRVQASVEFSTPELARSEYDFTRFEVVADARIETFFQRRLFPNALDLRLDAAASLGTLPLQRFGVIEASPLPYTPFGALRTLDDRPYQGEHHVALFWEHNFRTVPFELLGWQAPVDQDVEFILHGGHGRTWIDRGTTRQLGRRGILLRSSDGFHHELGLSLNGLLYDSVRLDVTKRLDGPGLSIGLSVLRFL